MSRKQKNELKPFLSLLIVLGTLFFTVFVKMEVRQKGYRVLKEVRTYNSVRDEVRMQTIEYAKMVTPRRLNHVAQHRLTLHQPNYGQIIQISGDQVALKQ